MRKIIIITLFLNVSFLILGQGLKTYSGAYENGKATYTYFEDDNYERIFKGNFSYYLREYHINKGYCIFKYKGNFNNNLKSDKWIFTVETEKNEPTRENVSGNYKKGLKNGAWQLKSVKKRNGKLVRFSKVHFRNDTLIKDFSFKYIAPRELWGHSDYSYIDCIGKFDENGFLNGEWKTTYKKWDNTEFQEIRKYKKGVLFWYLHRNLATGEVMKKNNQTDLINTFFENYIDSLNYSKIEGVKYGIEPTDDRPDEDETPFFEVLRVWYNPNSFETFDIYNANNPYHLFDKGSFIHEEDFTFEKNIIKVK